MPERRCDLVAAIDFGNTNSRIAVVEGDGQATVIRNYHGDTVTPSVALLEENGDWLVGMAARWAAASFPDRFVADAPRRLGKDPSFTFRVGNRECLAEHVCAEILRQLKKDAETQCGLPVTKTLIAIPANLSSAGKSATERAAKLAGFEAVHLIEACTVAALAGVGSVVRPRRVLVFDLGGTSLQIAIVQINDGELRLLSAGGDMAFGGRDWDDRLVQYAAERLHEISDEAPCRYPVSHHEMLCEAEKMKLSFSFMECVSMPSPSRLIRVDVSRCKFEEMTADLLDKARASLFELFERAYRDRECKPRDVDNVVLCGGGVLMPQIQQMVRDVMPQEVVTEDPECVVRGAARYAEAIGLNSATRAPDNSGATKPDERMSQLDENVQFTVYRPRAVRPEKWYDVLAFAHLDELPEDAEDDRPDPVEEI